MTTTKETLLLSPGDIRQPIALARALMQHGLSLKEAHAALDRLAAGESVRVDLPRNDLGAAIADLSAQGVTCETV